MYAAGFFAIKVDAERNEGSRKFCGISNYMLMFFKNNVIINERMLRIAG